MKLACIIQIHKIMFPVKKGINRINILFKGSHKSFPIQYGLWGEFLKRILTYLFWIKYN